MLGLPCYPGAGYFLYHSDNSLVPSYMEKASPAPRGHRGYEEGPFKPIGVGGTIFYPLKKSAIFLTKFININ